jgi:hypothetical protein
MDVLTRGIARSLGMKPIESNVSPYLQQPLRSYEEVRQQREQRQRELADAQARQQKLVLVKNGTAAAPAASNGAASTTRVNETV